jgi:hypothetical protein
MPPLGDSDGFLRITSRGDASPRLIEPYRPTVKEGLADTGRRAAPEFRPFLVLKDSQTSGRLTRPSGIFSPQPLPEVRLAALALRELGPFLILRSEVARGMECGYVVLSPVALQQGRLRTAPVTLATGAVSYSEKGKCNHHCAKTTVVNAHEIRNAVPISFIHSQ